jgi:glycosyltransferase involved in cell wall biosynthesis
MIPYQKNSITKETFILVMPVLNEEAFIEESVSSWLPVMNKFPGSEIIVVDGGSNDNTLDKLLNLNTKISFLNVFQKKSKTHGRALHKAYQLAIQTGHDWVFQTDSDGHHDPSDFERLWEKRFMSDFILGHRARRNDPLFRLALTDLASIWIYILFGVYIKDPNIPFRLMRRNYLKKILKRVPKGVFAPNIFLSILARKDGHNLYHIPVNHRSVKKTQANTKTILKGAFLGFFELLLFAI